VDDDADEQAHDLGSLLVGQTRVEAGPYLGEEIMGLLGHDLCTWSLCGGQAGL
jgi:hypothetical protein